MIELGKYTEKMMRERGAEVGRLIKRLAGLDGGMLDMDAFFEDLETLRCALNEDSFLRTGEEE